MLHFMLMYYKDEGLFKKCRTIPVPQWSAKWYGCLYRVDLNSSLAAECGVLAVTVKKSTMPHPNEGFGLLAARSFGSGKTIDLYEGTLGCKNLVDEKQKWKASGEGIMASTVQTFIKWENNILDKVADETGVERTAWIVPAPFCATGYVNDSRYFVGDGTLLVE